MDAKSLRVTTQVDTLSLRVHMWALLPLLAKSSSSKEKSSLKKISSCKILIKSVMTKRIKINPQLLLLYNTIKISLLKLDLKFNAILIS